MQTHGTDVALVTFITLTLLFLMCEAYVAPEQLQVYDNVNGHTTVCHDGFMSVYMSKVQLADLPFAVYIHDGRGRYYQAVAIANQCNYFLGESGSVIVLTVAPNGCFVRRQKDVTSLAVVIVAQDDKGQIEIVKTIPLTCEAKIKANKTDYPPESRHRFCNKDGFNITILKNAAVPPLNLEAVWIPSGQSENCKPKTRTANAVTFSFAFTDCGTKSVIADGIITYSVNIEGKWQLQKGAIFRDAPFNLAVHCSFALTQKSQLSSEIQKEKYGSTLRSKGILRTEMRFAKDSLYTSFYSSHNRPTVAHLGQPVYVEIFIPKHQDKDLVLLLEDCWATPTEDPHDPQRWNLLVKGCPFTGDSHRTVVLPVVPSKEVTYPSHHKRFEVKMFSFVKPKTSENLVYFHCNINICEGPACLQSCTKGSHKSRRTSSGQRILQSVVSGGPVYDTYPQKTPSADTWKAHNRLQRQ